MGCLQVLSLCLSHNEWLNHKAQTASPLGCVSTGGVVVTCCAWHSSGQQASPTSTCHWINTVCPFYLYHKLLFPGPGLTLHGPHKGGLLNYKSKCITPLLKPSSGFPSSPGTSPYVPTCLTTSSQSGSPTSRSHFSALPHPRYHLHMPRSSWHIHAGSPQPHVGIQI